MTITDQPTPTAELDDRIERLLAEWREHTEAAQAAFAAAAALITGRPAPADPHVERFATDVKAGDHVQWEDGWWYVEDATWCTPELQPIGSGALLTLTRVGYAPLELHLARNVLLTSVRPS